GGSYGKRPVTNHFAPQQQQQQQQHHHIFTSHSSSSLPKHEIYESGRRNCSSPLTTLGKADDDVRLDLDLDPLSYSADEDSGLPRSSSSHKASSDDFVSNHHSQDEDDIDVDDDDDDDGMSFFVRRSGSNNRYSSEQDGDEEERQSLLHGARKKGGREDQRTRERSLVRVRATCPNPPFDEEELPHNTSTGSSEYVESPRSDDAEETGSGDAYSSKSKPKPKSYQMDTIAYRETPHPTTAADADPDRMSPTPLDIHNRLYGNRNHRHDGQFWHYDNSNCDEDEGYSNSRSSYDSPSHRGASGGSGTNTNSTISSTSTSASFAVPTQVDAKIPFLGSGLAPSAMVCDSSKFSNHLQRGWSASAKAKAKTLKGRSKDDSDKLDQSVSTALVDVNGNPTTLSPSVYSQMRQSPYSPSSPAQQSNSINASTTTTSTTTTTTSSGSSTSGGHGSSAQTSADSELMRRQKRRDLKLNKQKTKQVVQYPEVKFEKDAPIDEILNFIHSEAGQGKKQAGKKAAPQEDAIAGADASSKVAAKKKPATKRDSTPVLNGQLSAEEAELGDFGITLKDMGNSVSVNGESEDNTTPSIIEDLEEKDRFFGSVGEEAVKTKKDHKQKNSEGKKEQPTATKENHTKQPVVKEENSGQKDSSDGSSKSNNTKKTKPKQTVGKGSTDLVSSVNGPLSPPANMVKSNQNSVDNVEGTDPYVSGLKNSDLDIGPKKEEVFVEVKKKKKRVVTKENITSLAPSNAPFVPNQYYSRNGNGVPSQTGFRNNGFQRQPRLTTALSLASSTTTSQAGSTYSTTYTTNATTTPIVSSSNTTLSVSSNSSSTSSGAEQHAHPPRDLSPSAFPVLEGHSLPPPAATEARRNSCGDATDLLVESKSMCDSDRESVKSLPATSHMYPISYAKMAAGSGGPRPGNNSSYPESMASPSSESGLGWQNSSSSSVTHTPSGSCHISSPGAAPTPHTPERKASNAVWKGS
ncbi:hypothetical protein EGW08_011550, partial [Elysia chlorotica]